MGKYRVKNTKLTIQNNQEMIQKTEVSQPIIET